MRQLGRRFCAALAVGGLALLAGCSELPVRSAVPVDPALPPATAGALAASLPALVRAHPGESGFIVLESGVEAFAARAWLTEQATRSIDIQCYVWKDDRTGQWLLEQLAAAAARGVRVRLLLDDANTARLDARLAQLDALDGVEVRLFNPYPHRGVGRLWDLVTDFDRVHRRMHNKAWIADGHAMILGGRNVGDPYFDPGNEEAFADLDVLGIGPVVGEVTRSFDAYWNSRAAYPLRDVVPAPEPAPVADALVGAHVAALRARPEGQRWRDAGPAAANYVWGPAVVTADPPDKVFEAAPAEQLMVAQLGRVIGQVERSFDLVSPYFVPLQGGVDYFAGLRARGVRTRVLTNSLAAIDVVAVHAGYAPWRAPLIATGTELYEVRRASEPVEGSAAFGGVDWSRASLHAKTFTVDGERVFIGSFNFDPRSAWLNTEIGVMITDRALAQRVNRTFDEEVPRFAWRVTAAPDGGLRWTVQTDRGPLQMHAEPEASLWRRFAARVLGWLPIDGLL